MKSIKKSSVIDIKGVFNFSVKIKIEAKIFNLSLWSPPQTDSRLFYPDINNRLQTPAPPTPQPIRRERTFGGFSQSDNDMDPFTKQYYTRMWKQNMSPENM